MQTFKCKICDRPMPPRVFEAHMKKRHAGMESQNTDVSLGQVPKTATEEANLVVTKKDGLHEVSVEKSDLSPGEYCHNCLAVPGVWEYQKPENCICSCHKKKIEFDWGEVYKCASCGAEYPAKAMDFHSKVVHGV